MLLVPCPYCGPRPEIEFRCGGEAHIAAARSGRRRSDEDWARLSLLPHEPEGPAPRALVPPPRLRPLVQRDRATRSADAVRGEPQARRGAHDAVSPSGGRIDRSRPLRFSFDGRGYRGFAGDTLASALLANGVHLVGRSFKYHRPRGIMTAGAEEPNALIQLERPGGRSDPNLRATEIELYDGLTAASQNRWPSLGFDVGAVNDLLVAAVPGRLLLQDLPVAGGLVEVGLRAAASAAPPASAGRPTRPDPDRYLHRHAHCDVLVVGGGPGRADGGAGGRPQRRAGDPVPSASPSSAARCWPRAARSPSSTAARRCAGCDGRWPSSTRCPRSRSCARTTAFGYLDHNYLVAARARRPTTCRCRRPNPPRQRLWRVRAKQVVLATGAIERPLVFAGNDRPGVMLASARAATYLNRYGVLPGRARGAVHQQ